MINEIERNIPYKIWNSEKQQIEEIIKGNCEICGKLAILKESYVFLTSYGIRKHEKRLMCSSCISLERKGKL